MLRENIRELTAAQIDFGQGKERPPYGFLKAKQPFMVSTNVFKDDRLQWMTVFRFAHEIQLENGWDDAKSIDEWNSLKNRLPPLQVHAYGKRILFSAGSFVYTQQVQPQEGELALGHKPIRQPRAEYFQERVHWLGHDHIGL